jgi:guanylate kinase
MTTRAPRLWVISAPSGAGKTSLVRALLAARSNLAVSVSHTTRRQRPNELDGRDYHFVDIPRFERMVAAGAFLEHARVFDNYYGTGRAQLEAQLAAGHDVLLEIDWQGARQVRAALADCTTIFVLPPSRAALEQRLKGRGTDTPEVIARRLADAVTDMSHWREFDYVLINDRFEQAIVDLTAILDGHGEAQRADRAALGAFTAGLLA